MTDSACCICLESCSADFTSVQCVGGHSRHFVCNEDLGQYCTENVFTKLYRMHRDACTIPCPIPNCTGHLPVVQVARLLPAVPKKRLLNIIRDTVCDDHPKVGETIAAVHDAMTLRCPTCKLAVDPVPDACSAIQCLYCSKYYCNYCFESFENRESAHLHAGSHNNDIPNDPFLSAERVAQGQLLLLHSRLSNCLQNALSGCNSELDIQCCRLGLCLCLDDAAIIGISLADIWQDIVQESVVDGPVSCTNAVTAEDRILEDEPRHITESEKLARLLAQALLSDNDIAAQQILSCQSVPLDLKYVVQFQVAEEMVSHSLVGLAALLGKQEIVDRLIILGANLEEMTEVNGKRTALHILIEKGLTASVQLAFKLSRVSQIDRRLDCESNRYSAIHVAALYNQPQLILLLAAQGASLTLQEAECGYSPLSLALVFGHLDAALSLISVGAPFSLHDCGSTTCPMRIAAEFGHWRAVDHMLRAYIQRTHCTPFDAVNQYVDIHQSTMLHTAVQFQQQSVIERLLHSGANVLQPNETGISSLQLAVHTCNDCVVVMMLKKIPSLRGTGVAPQILNEVMERQLLCALRTILERWPLELIEYEPLHMAMRLKALNCLHILAEFTEYLFPSTDSLPAIDFSMKMMDEYAFDLCLLQMQRHKASRPLVDRIEHVKSIVLEAVRNEILFVFSPTTFQELCNYSDNALNIDSMIDLDAMKNALMEAISVQNRSVVISLLLLGANAHVSFDNHITPVTIAKDNQLADILVLLCPSQTE